MKSYSKASSRRNRAQRTAGLRLLCAALVILFPAPVGAQDVKLTVSVAEGIVRADVAFRWERQEELLSALQDGLESRITFTLRLFEKRPAALPFLENSLVVEKSISQSAFYDFLEHKYIVESEGGGRRSFDRPEDLINGFFSWTGIALDSRARLRSPFVTARVQFDPVRLMPPLTIVSLIGATGTYTSPWVMGKVAPR